MIVLSSKVETQADTADDGNHADTLHHSVPHNLLQGAQEHNADGEQDDVGAAHGNGVQRLGPVVVIFRPVSKLRVLQWPVADRRQGLLVHIAGGLHRSSLQIEREGAVQRVPSDASILVVALQGAARGAQTEDKTLRGAVKVERAVAVQIVIAGTEGAPVRGSVVHVLAVHVGNKGALAVLGDNGSGAGAGLLVEVALDVFLV